MCALIKRKPHSSHTLVSPAAIGAADQMRTAYARSNTLAATKRGWFVQRQTMLELAQITRARDHPTCEHKALRTEQNSYSKSGAWGHR